MGSMHTGLEDFGVVKSNPFTGRGGFAGLAAYFAERAKGGVALMVTGGVSPNRAGKVRFRRRFFPAAPLVYYLQSYVPFVLSTFDFFHNSNS